MPMEASASATAPRPASAPNAPATASPNTTGSPPPQHPTNARSPPPTKAPVPQRAARQATERADPVPPATASDVGLSWVTRGRTSGRACGGAATPLKLSRPPADRPLADGAHCARSCACGGRRARCRPPRRAGAPLPTRPGWPRACPTRSARSCRSTRSSHPARPRGPSNPPSHRPPSLVFRQERSSSLQICRGYSSDPVG